MAITLPPALLTGAARAAAVSGQLAPIAAIGVATYGAYKLFVPKKTFFDRVENAAEKVSKTLGPITAVIGILTAVDTFYTKYKDNHHGRMTAEEWEEEMSNRLELSKKEDEEKETRQKEFKVAVDMVRAEEEGKRQAAIDEAVAKALSGRGTEKNDRQSLSASGAKINRATKKTETKKAASATP